ncbi:TRAP transporter substrate-binding protein [Afifella sp. IM 167]|uniref:TRAP transporter substrate-binding protein n=1 Tax=Afifella sp. IM 167 TaxID=2033586 RepID=UPI001CCCEFB8|nr:TRAP transporter substrate-binding protein [Afifella sp. IM 167]
MNEMKEGRLARALRQIDHMRGRDGEPGDELRSAERRRFLSLSAKFGFTTAMVAAAAGTLFSEEASAQTASEERERESAAKYTITLATEYRIGTTRSYPMIQLNVKENLQNFSNGAIYVKLQPGGALGTGTALAQKVQAGTVEIGQFSLSNFAPFAPAVDLINLPYWCGENQKFVNLITSDVWENQVNKLVREKGFEPMFYFCIDPRTAAKRRGLSDGPFKTPADLEGIKFRVPGSEILKQFYRLLGANPTPVAWGETPSALKQGVADALDPSLGALYAFGFADVLSWVTFNRPVPDSQVYGMNKQWFDGLDGETKEAIKQASETCLQQNLAQVPASRAFAMAEMRKAGVEFYVPTEDELAQWKDKAGAQRPEWDEIKTQILGSPDKFQALVDAANSQGRYYVNDV